MKKIYETSEARRVAVRKSQRRYAKQRQTPITLKFNNSKDADIIEWLEQQPSKLEYIRTVVRADIGRKK